MNRWVGNVAFVTGASSGIGASISEKLVEAGIKVIGFARRKEKLDELANKWVNLKGKFYPYPGDVTKEEDIVKAIQWAKTNVGPISILINNAGIAPMSGFVENKTNVFKNALDINTVAPLIASREVLKQMEENKIDGIIININSVAGKKITTSAGIISMYQATKYALTALTDCLRAELTNKGSKIRVTGIHPGMVYTEMVEKNLAAVGNRNLENVGTKYPMLQSEDVANAVVFVLSTPQHVQIAELTIKPVGEI